MTKRPFPAGAPFGEDPHHLRDDVAGLANHHRVADPDILLPQVILVMQGGPADRGTGHLDGLEQGERRDGAGTADIDHDVQDLGGLLLGRIFVGDLGARRFGGGAELRLLRQGVELDDDAVDLVGQLVPPPGPPVAKGDDLLDVPAEPGLGVDREAQPPQEIQGVPLRGHAGFPSA